MSASRNNATELSVTGESRPERSPVVDVQPNKLYSNRLGPIGFTLKSGLTVSRSVGTSIATVDALTNQSC